MAKPVHICEMGLIRAEGTRKVETGHESPACLGLSHLHPSCEAGKDEVDSLGCRRGGPAGKYYLACPVHAPTTAACPQCSTVLTVTNHPVLCPPYSLARITAHKWAFNIPRVLLSMTGKLLVHITEIKQVGIIICSSSPLLCNSQVSSVGLSFKCIWSGTYFLVLVSNNHMLKTIPAVPLFVSFSTFLTL